MQNTTTNISKSPTKSLYFLSFIEGGSLMAVEILSAKIIAPFFGNSIYVWAAVLATTLLGLAGGYFYGGNLSTKKNVQKKLVLASLTGAILTLLLPLSSKIILQNTLGLGLQMGTIIASLFILFPIIFCFGMVSPLIIKITSSQFSNSGKNASVIYTISTIGGILFALITGLYLITSFGIKNTCFFVGTLLLTSIIVLVITSKKS